MRRERNWGSSVFLIWAVFGFSWVATRGYAEDLAFTQRDTVLVTGATGFVGQRTVAMLLYKGVRVRALVRRTSDLSVLPQDDSLLTLVYGDIGDETDVNRAVEGCTAVVHTAAKVSDWAPFEEFRTANIEGTQNVVRACRRHGVKRLVHISTTDVFGVRVTHGRYTDDSPYVVNRYPYVATKIAAERAVKDAIGQGVPAVILRPSWIYGPGDRQFLPEAVNLLQSRLLAYFGSSAFRISFNHVDNLTAAIWLGLTKEAAIGEAFISNDGALTWKQFAAAVAEPLGLPLPVLTLPRLVGCPLAFTLEMIWGAIGGRHRPPLTNFTFDALGNDITFDSTKLRDRLGYEARHPDPEKGLRSVVGALRK